MILWVDCKDPADLEKFIHEKLRSLKWVLDTKSTWTKEIWNAAA